MVTHLWWLVVICHCGSCDMAASHVKNEKWGVGLWDSPAETVAMAGVATL